MATNSEIEWTEATWNPVIGCTKVSPGCANCYAETMARRLACMADADVEKGRPPSTRKHAYTRVVRYKDGIALPQWNGKAVCVPEALTDPLKWRKPRRVFVNSMSDLFHEDVPFEFIDKVFAVMALTQQHTYQVLTKRPNRMAEYTLYAHGKARPAGSGDCLMLMRETTPYLQVGDCLDEGVGGFFKTEREWNYAQSLAGKLIDVWPLPNVWLGTSVENQKTADERIPHLLRCPAAVRWLSCEPLLGEVDLCSITDKDRFPGCADFDVLRGHMIHHDDDFKWTPEKASIDWVVCGGESGKGARPMHADWARSLRDQCADAGVPFFFKQWGQWCPYEHDAQPPFLTGQDGNSVDGHTLPDLSDPNELVDGWMMTGDCQVYRRVGKKHAGRLLDGVEHSGYPESLDQSMASHEMVEDGGAA